MGQALLALMPAFKVPFAVRSPIFGLVFFWNPFAVIWKIPEVIVDPLYRIARRFRPHINKEVHEIIPALAYCDATAPVIFVFSVIWISTALAHCFPYVIFNWCFIVSSISVTEIRGVVFSGFFEQAAT